MTTALQQAPSPPAPVGHNDSSVRVIQLPLSGTAWATLQASFPLSEEAWDQMMTMLVAMKAGLVVGAPKQQSTAVDVPVTAPWL